MDISNISAMYQNYSQTAAGSATGNQISQLQGKDMSQATDEELMDACKEFESYLLEQVFKEMTKTVSFVDKDDTNSTLVEYFGDNVIQEISKQSTETQGLGIAQQLYEQMKRNYNL